MKTASEFAMNDATKDYCAHCARPDGSMKSFVEQKESLIGFVVRTQGLDKTVAAKAVESMMMKLPAWAGYFA
jgi:hypothetical protein